VPEVHLVISLINKDDFLMHGVVLQSRVQSPRPAMFHVKHLCVKLRCATVVFSHASRSTSARSMQGPQESPFAASRHAVPIVRARLSLDECRI